MKISQKGLYAWPPSSKTTLRSEARRREPRKTTRRRFCRWSRPLDGASTNEDQAGRLPRFLFVDRGHASGQTTTVRVGAFPNITHPQAMIGKANGAFEKAMGPNVKIDWKTFNAGPSANYAKTTTFSDSLIDICSPS